MSKKIIKLSESGFQTMSNQSLIPSIKNISIEDLKKGYVNLLLIPHSITFGDKLYSPVTIKEAYGDILEPTDVSKKIIKKYRLPESFVSVVEAYNNIAIYIIVAQIGKNDEVIAKDMDKMGYFLSSKGDVEEVEGMSFQTLRFEPYCQMQEDITDYVKENNKVIYHWTPLYNIENITKNGLIPNHSNSYFNYPPRTYLFEGKVDSQRMFAFGQMLAIANKSKDNNGQYLLLSIDLVNLPDSIRFFNDPNSELGIYTEQAIPPNHVKVLREVTFVTTLKPQDGTEKEQS